MRFLELEYSLSKITTYGTETITPFATHHNILFYTPQLLGI